MFPALILASSDLDQSGHMVARRNLLRNAVLATAFRPQHEPEPSHPRPDHPQEQTGPVPR